MRLVKSFSTGKFSDCKVGELVGFGYTNQSVAIILEMTEKLVLLGVIASDDDNMVIETSHSGNDCIRYGAEWLLELVPFGVGKLPDSDAVYWPGSVTVATDGTFFRFGPNPHNAIIRSSKHFNFEDMKFGEPKSSGLRAISNGWKIWLCEEDRNRPGAAPFVSMDGPPKKPLR